jgi:hypothetical protein
MKIVATSVLLGITLLVVPIFSYLFGTALGPLEWQAMHTLMIMAGVGIASHGQFCPERSLPVAFLGR